MLELQAKLTECRSEITTLGDNLLKANAETSEKKATVESLAARCDELKTKLCESEKLRRILHNTVQDLKVSSLASEEQIQLKFSVLFLLIFTGKHQSVLSSATTYSE